MYQLALWLSETDFKTAIHVYLLELPTFDCKFSLSLGSVDALLHCHIILSLRIGGVSVSVLPYPTATVSLQNLMHNFASPYTSRDFVYWFLDWFLIASCFILTGSGWFQSAAYSFVLFADLVLCVACLLSVVLVDIRICILMSCWFCSSSVTHLFSTSPLRMLS